MPDVIDGRFSIISFKVIFEIPLPLKGFIKKSPLFWYISFKSKIPDVAEHPVFFIVDQLYYLKPFSILRWCLKARRERFQKRSIHIVCEHFESACNAAYWH